MSDARAIAHALTMFPAPLRDLVESELAAGNLVVEIASTFPAPAAGACVRLARQVTTRPRASSPGVVFAERRSSHHAGEFADPQRMYFVIEPPDPPPQPADMDAIRAELDERERAANADRFRPGGFW